MWVLELLFVFLELLIAVLSAAGRGELNSDDKGKGRKQPVYTPQRETLEFTDCALCGKPNSVNATFCSACGALQGTAQA